MKDLARILGLCVLVGVIAAPALAQGNGNNPCDVAGETPDLIVGDIHQQQRWGTTGDITAYSIGTVSCNIGSCWANWYADDNNHPVIGQNMFRLKAGRFEQIGQSWLKHGYTALSMTLCGNCLGTNGQHLGVNCSDPYSSNLNGTHTRLGPKFEVNPASGSFPYPPTNGGSSSADPIYKRLQVHNADLNPALNAGALYYVEGQYIAIDDANAKNHHNNASYRKITVSGTSTFAIAFDGATVRQKLAIEVWPTLDSTVVLTEVAADGRIVVATKVSDLGGGIWHYEYAIHNMNSARSIRSFTVPLPAGAQVSNVGFHDVDYHSGEPFSGADWTPTVGAGSITWATQTLAQNPNANALRWGTLYNFRFDANVLPATNSGTLEYFVPGNPASSPVSVQSPRLCNQNGLCEPGETCANCAGDCALQGGGSGCCGNGTCEVGESPCLCISDCGAQTLVEIACAGGIDEDCDGDTDCLDTDCCTDVLCEGSDLDDDGFAACDCDDTKPGVWATPGEVFGLMAVRDPVLGAILTWSPPTEWGGTLVRYDALRSADANDFVSAATCLFLPDPTDEQCTDAAVPALGTSFFYLVRATNDCPVGDGSLGEDTGGEARVGRSCP